VFYRLLLMACLALEAAATTSAAAQTYPEGLGPPSVGRAAALAAHIRAFHRWTGLTPLPADYCVTMREGEAVQKALAKLAGRAILYRQPGLALELQRAGDALSDALDEEEFINQQAEIPFVDFPCPVPAPAYPARAVVLRLVEPRMPFCRMQGNALRISFEARRAMMQQCLRLPRS